jgi:hypothetical protein
VASAASMVFALPFEQPVRFEMAINGEAAHTIRATIPSSVLVRAD